MSAAPDALKNVTLQEYLEMDAASEDFLEYHDGEVVAMSAGSYDHAQIIRKLLRSLGNRLQGSPCEEHGATLNVGNEETRHYVHPDVTVICGEPQFHINDRSETLLVNPRVLFEVLSKSTEAYDRGDKAKDYRLIPSLDEHFLLSQHRPEVEGYHRQADGSWSLRVWSGLEAVAQVRCLGLDLPLAELYPAEPAEA